MIRHSAPRPARASRLGFCFATIAAIVGPCGPSGFVGVASAQEPETTGSYGTFGNAGGYAGSYGGSGYGGGCSSCGSCNTCQPCETCQTHHCPPKLQYCMEGEPKIHVKIGCPRPICNPCAQPNWGYYEKCWNPWPFPPSFTHCPTPPPAATVALTERAYGGLTPFYGPDPQPQPTSTPRNYATPAPQVQPAPQAPPYMPPMPTQPPMRTTPVPTPMPSTTAPGAPGNPLESLPIPRQETLRPMPGNLDDF
jgi:hypothetical protein